MEYLFKKIRKTSLWSKIMMVSLIIIVYYIFNRENSDIEGFEQLNKIVFKEQDNIYDQFYSSVYDDLKNNMNKNEYEISSIINNTSLNKNDKLLDIGSGTGKHVNLLTKKNIDATGLDKSKAMIQYSKNKYPKCKFKLGDANNTNLFKPHFFTHITMLNLTIYEFKNKGGLIKNCYEWIKPGGFLIIHLVNPSEFNPVLKKSDPLNILDNTALNEKDKKNTFIKFKNFSYKNIFDFNNKQATFKETFTDLNNKKRINTLKLNMETSKDIANIVKREGFIQDVIVDLYSINYPNQFLYFFYKPE